MLVDQQHNLVVYVVVAAGFVSFAVVSLWNQWGMIFPGVMVDKPVVMKMDFCWLSVMQCT